MRVSAYNIVAMKWFILTVVFFTCITYAGDVFSQASSSSEVIITPVKAARGTYQFIYSRIDTTSLFTDDLLVTIEQQRDQQIVKFIRLNDHLVVKILPYVVINSPGFTGIPEIVFKDEKEK
jgi:hypothetical protein